MRDVTRVTLTTYLHADAKIWFTRQADAHNTSLAAFVRDILELHWHTYSEIYDQHPTTHTIHEAQPAR